MMLLVHKGRRPRKPRCWDVTRKPMSSFFSIMNLEHGLGSLNCLTHMKDYIE